MALSIASINGYLAAISLALDLKMYLPRKNEIMLAIRAAIMTAGVPISKTFEVYL